MARVWQNPKWAHWNRQVGVPVDADGAQVKDGGGAQHDVHAHQAVAHARAQRPHAVLELQRKQSDDDCNARLPRTGHYIRYSSPKKIK